MIGTGGRTTRCSNLHIPVCRRLCTQEQKGLGSGHQRWPRLRPVDGRRKIARDSGFGAIKAMMGIAIETGNERPSKARPPAIALSLQVHSSCEAQQLSSSVLYEAYCAVLRCSLSRVNGCPCPRANDVAAAHIFYEATRPAESTPDRRAQRCRLAA